MLGYILRRASLIVPVFLGVSLIAFMLLQLAPGDPVQIWMGGQASSDPKLYEEYRAKLGLDQPVYVQYGHFLWRLLHGDLGVDFRNGRPALEEALEALPRTMQLAVAGVLVSIAVGLPTGIYAAKKHNSLFDRVTMVWSYVGSSLPVFWLALILIIVFSVRLNITPISGFGTPAHLLLPALALGLNQAGITSRFTRSSMLEVIRQDWVSAGRINGLSESLLNKQIFKSALIPIITVIGLEFGYLLGNAFFIEYVFAWPGIGRLAFRGIQERNFAIIQASAFIISVSFVLINLVVDILYAYIDPRVRFGAKKE